MDTQTVFNIFLILVAVASIVKNIMRIAGLVKNQYVGGTGASAVYLITNVASLIGWGIFLILLMAAGNFMMEKITLLTGW